MNRHSGRPTAPRSSSSAVRGRRPGHGLFAVDVASGTTRTILAPSPSSTWPVPRGPRMGPDRVLGVGRREKGSDARTHVIAADGTDDRVLPSPPDAVWNAGSAWSNDGTRLFILRGYGPAYEDVRPTVHPRGWQRASASRSRMTGRSTASAAPTSSGRPTTPGSSPRRRHELGHPQPQVIIDPQTGTSEPAPWTIDQRSDLAAAGTLTDRRVARGQGRTPGWSGPGVQEKALVAGTGFEPVTFGL